jgi:hypothetical protein
MPTAFSVGYLAEEVASAGGRTDGLRKAGGAAVSVSRTLLERRGVLGVDMVTLVGRRGDASAGDDDDDGEFSIPGRRCQ